MDHEKKDEEDRPPFDKRISSLNRTDHSGDTFSSEYSSLMNLVFNEKCAVMHPSRQALENENTSLSALPKQAPQIDITKPSDDFELHTRHIPGAFQIDGTRSPIRRISLSSSNNEHSESSEGESTIFLLPKADLVDQGLKDVEVPSNGVARSSRSSFQLGDIPVAVAEAKDRRCFRCCATIGILSIVGLLIAVVSLLVRGNKEVAIPMVATTSEPILRPTFDPNLGVTNGLATTSPTDFSTVIDDSVDTDDFYNGATTTLPPAAPAIDMSQEPTISPSQWPSTKPATTRNPDSALEPTPHPISEPTRNPTPHPTPGPTGNPAPNPTPGTQNPTRRPTRNPTPNPTPRPTRNPTPNPTPGATPRPTRTPPPPSGGGKPAFKEEEKVTIKKL